MDFTVPLAISEKNYTLRVSEFNNATYRTILKYLQNDDKPHLTKFLDNLVDQVIENKNDTLTRKDKACILLTSRSISIGPELELTFTCPTTQKPYKGTVDIPYIVEKLCQTHEYPSKTVKINDKVEVLLKMHESLWIPPADTLDAVTDVVSTIKIDNKIYTLDKIDLTDRRKLIESLDGSVFGHVSKYITDAWQAHEKIQIITDRNPHDPEQEPKEYNINLYDNTLFDFICLSLAGNLRESYQMIYTLTNHMQFSPGYVDNITPVETTIYFNIKTQEIERQKQEQQTSQQNNSPTLGGLGAPSL